MQGKTLDFETARPKKNHGNFFSRQIFLFAIADDKYDDECVQGLITTNESKDRQ